MNVNETNPLPDAEAEGQRALRDAVRTFAEAEVGPLISRMEQTKRMPRSLISRMKQLDYYAIQYPASYGGAGGTFTDYVAMMEELSRVYCSIGAHISVNSLCSGTIFDFGTAEQKTLYLRDLLTGSAIGSFAFTEASTGTDPRAVTTTCVRDGDYWIINGQKLFISNSTMPGYVCVFCRDKEMNDSITCVVVPKDANGYAAGKLVEKMGMHGLEVADITLDGVRVPLENTVGGDAGRGKGFHILTAVIADGKLGISAQCVGMAQAALEAAVKYARERTQRGKPIIKLPTIQSLIGEMSAEVEAARLMTLSTANKRSQGQSILYDSARTRLFASQVAHRATSNAMQVHGAYGYTTELPVERLYRDAKLAELYEGVNEIQRIIAAFEYLP